MCPEKNNLRMFWVELSEIFFLSKMVDEVERYILNSISKNINKKGVCLKCAVSNFRETL